MKPIFIILIIVLLLIIAGIIRSIYEIHSLSVSKYKIKSDKVSKDNSLHLVFLSDLHGKSYGKNNEKLIKLINEAKPDVILVGGDLLVSKKPEKDKRALELAGRLTEIAPVYIAPGNHEKAVSVLTMFKERNKQIRAFFDEKSIVVLENEKKSLNDEIEVFGLDIDYRFYKKFHPEIMTEKEIQAYTESISKEKFTIMLAHNPLLFELYSKTCAGLVLSGHVHGGTMILPGIGGVISPSLKLFPKYDKGLFSKNGTDMIVSSGCGSHTVDIRIFNKPEIVVIDIEGERGTN